MKRIEDFEEGDFMRYKKYESIPCSVTADGGVFSIC